MSWYADVRQKDIYVRVLLEKCHCFVGIRRAIHQEAFIFEVISHDISDNWFVLDNEDSITGHFTTVGINHHNLVW